MAKDSVIAKPNATKHDGDNNATLRQVQGERGKELGLLVVIAVLRRVGPVCTTTFL